MSPPAQALAFAIVAGLAALFTSEKWREYREVTIGAAEHGVELPTFSEYAAFQIGRYRTIRVLQRPVDWRIDRGDQRGLMDAIHQADRRPYAPRH
jgi:hypothetical protein